MSADISNTDKDMESGNSWSVSDIDTIAQHQLKFYVYVTHKGFMTVQHKFFVYSSSAAFHSNSNKMNENPSEKLIYI